MLSLREGQRHESATPARLSEGGVVGPGGSPPMRIESRFEARWSLSRKAVAVPSCFTSGCR